MLKSIISYFLKKIEKLSRTDIGLKLSRTDIGLLSENVDLDPLLKTGHTLPIFDWSGKNSCTK